MTEQALVNDGDVQRRVEQICGLYQELGVESHGPARTMKMTWDDLGLDSEQQQALDPIADGGRYFLVHEEIRQAFSRSIQRARAEIEKVGVFAGGKYLVPKDEVDDLCGQIAEERLKFRRWLESEASIDTLQAQVVSRFVQHADVQGFKYGEPARVRILQYARERVPDRERILRWDYAIAVRELSLPLIDVSPVVAETSLRDMGVIQADIAERVNGMLLGVCSGLARSPDLMVALTRGEKTIRQHITRCDRHNVLLADPLVDRVCAEIKRMTADPMACGEDERRQLRSMVSNLEAQRALAMHLRGPEVARASSVLRLKTQPAPAPANGDEVQPSLLPGLI